MDEKIIVFNEPHVSGGVAKVTITEEQAIKHTRKLNHNIVMDDEHAVRHFMLVNLAWYRDDECLDRPI